MKPICPPITESPSRTSNSLNMSSVRLSPSPYHLRASTRRSSAIVSARLAVQDAQRAYRLVDNTYWWRGLRANATKTASDMDAACDAATQAEYAGARVRIAIISYLTLLYGADLANRFNTYANRFKTHTADNRRIWRNYERVARRMSQIA